MSKSLKFLFAPLDADGHIYASIGIAQQLLQRGHNVVFVTPNSYKGKLCLLGFKEVYAQEPIEIVSKDEWIQRIQLMAPLMAMSPMELLEHLYVPYFKYMVQDAKVKDKKLREIMEEEKPDVVVLDCFIHTPALMDQEVPWVLLTSINSVALSNQGVPPAFTGYPIRGGNKSTWGIYRNKQKTLFQDVFNDFKAWVLEKKGPELIYSDFPLWVKYSPHANIYMQPKELCYTHIRPDPSKWTRIDAFVRTEDDEFQIPPEIQSLPGKLIYLSMGTWGCYEIELMKKLLGMLGKSPNRFIISKGPLADELEFSSNMWGLPRVPQTKVIPLVDLVITHGGNNTITESFYFGKRILVLPLCFDQLDNGQRIQETGLGIKLNPYHCTEDELLSSIEKLLDNDLLEKQMISISERMQATNSQKIAADIIENVISK